MTEIVDPPDADPPWAGAPGADPAPDGPCPDLLRVAVEHDGRTTVLRLIGELDLAGVAYVRAHIRRALRHRPDRLLLDLSDLTFIDSTGLGLMVWAHQAMAERGHQLRLHHPRQRVRRLLRITGLDTRLHVTVPPSGPGGDPETSGDSTGTGRRLWIGRER